MLRRVETDSLPVNQSAAAFGFSRPSFYQAQASFQQGGLPALMPRTRGPKRAHKPTADVLTFIPQPFVRKTRPYDWPRWFRASRIVMASRFILLTSNALWRAVKKTAMNEALPQPVAGEDWVARYEQLRKDVPSQATGGGFGIIILLRQGMIAWIRTCADIPVPASARESVQRWDAIRLLFARRHSHPSSRHTGGNSSPSPSGGHSMQGDM